MWHLTGLPRLVEGCDRQAIDHHQQEAVADGIEVGKGGGGNTPRLRRLGAEESERQSRREKVPADITAEEQGARQHLILVLRARLLHQELSAQRGPWGDALPAERPQ